MCRAAIALQLIILMYHHSFHFVSVKNTLSYRGGALYSKNITLQAGPVATGQENFIVGPNLSGHGFFAQMNSRLRIVKRMVQNPFYINQLKAVQQCHLISRQPNLHRQETVQDAADLARTRYRQDVLSLVQ
jgi:hypothetical protein